MIIIGIDPGTERTGFGVLEKTSHAPSGFRHIEHGVIQTPRSKSAGERLLILEEELTALFIKYSPFAIGVERLFFTKNQKTVMAVSEAKGVVLLAAARQRIPIHEVTPPQVKMAIGGYGKADKQQIQRMVKETLQLDAIPKPDDAADALGIGIACGLLVFSVGRLQKQ